MSSENHGGGLRAAPLATVTRNGATPALADQWEAEALDAIENVQDPAEAERLLGRVTLATEAMRIAKLGEDRERRWKALWLKAERRYGELLPPKQPGKRTDKATSGSLPGVDPDQAKRARKVAAVPDDVFNDYVANDPKPSREGLLRKATDPKKRPRENDAEKPAVLEWVRARRDEGMSRERIAAASKAGERGYPGSRPLSDRVTGQVLAILRALDARPEPQSQQPKAPKKVASWGGKRLRQLHADKREGRRDPESDLWKMQVAIAEAVSVLERRFLNPS